MHFTDTNAPDLFQINEDDGVVSVMTVFDREEWLHINALVELTIKVMIPHVCTAYVLYTVYWK